MKILVGDCRAAMRELEPCSVDAVVTDPPYGLEFMGKGWDRGVPGEEFWSAALRVAKPGAHLLAFGGTRTYHRLACAIEDAGWEIRDCIFWVYGSGFPKSLDVSKAIDKAAGAEREDLGPSPTHHGGGTNHVYAQDAWTREHFAEKARATAPATDLAREWSGWGTALKPAVEPILLARKPLVGTVAENVQAHGTGAINIDGCRIGTSKRVPGSLARVTGLDGFGKRDGRAGQTEEDSGQDPSIGRWPANLIHDGSEEVLAAFPDSTARHGPETPYAYPKMAVNAYSSDKRVRSTFGHGDTGTAARFFYCAKASRSERGAGNVHPTVKPLALMRYLVRLVTPPGGLVLDPFTGSGTTGCACVAEGFRFLGIEQSEEYAEIARRRIARMQGKRVEEPEPESKPLRSLGPLFGEATA